MYYSAASLVRHGQAAQLYTGADTGTDPQKLVATPDTPIFREAQRQGLSFVGLYVYPPILADLLLPYTLLPLRSATTVWLISNVVFLVVTALLLARLIGWPLRSGKAALLALSCLCFPPALQCLVDGQITILLLLLWAVGLLLYQRDRVEAAAAVFALATAIKLTPGLVVVPFLVWQHWRFLRAYAASLEGLVAVSLWIDTPHALQVFCTKVLPAMSGAIPYFTNYSLPAATQRLLTLVRTGAIAPYPSPLPASTVLAGRLASICIFALLTFALVRTRSRLSRQDQAYVLALLGLLAPVLSPVSWFHAYATSFVAFALLWERCLRRVTGWTQLIWLTAVSLLLGTALSENLASTLIASPRFHALVAWLQMAQLLAAAGLLLQQILAAPRERNGLAL